MMGCTANIAYFDEENSKVFIANLGDSKAMYCRFDKATGDMEIVPMGQQHWPNVQSERNRIKKADWDVQEI